jgi:SAM-dependent methyltransferase/uncharacterized protein YbaR (Trm112 family)
MRYSFLNFLQCPTSRTSLVCLTLQEVEAELPHVRQFSRAQRINQPGALVGPAPEFSEATPLTELLAGLACESAPPERNYHVRVKEGLLVSAESGRWYPIRNFIPELLPDHLRDFDRDFEFLEERREDLPEPIFELLNRPEVFTGRTVEDGGVGHKKSEMSIEGKITDLAFFGPGYIAPFNPGASEHTIYLLKSFAFCLPLLSANGTRKIILDAGCGYSWTTHWLMMIGFEPIGLDITRVYLDIAVERLGASLPYLMVADTENLPIRDGMLDAVLGYDAFHHIPDRNRAMHQFFRTLKPGGEVILSEPGSGHQQATGVQEIMDRFGTLEKGMDLSDVAGYIHETGFAAPKQHLVVKLEQDLAQQVTGGASYSPANLYSILKPA